MRWSKFVDLVTIVWLGIFIAGFAVTDPEIKVLCNNLNLGLLSVFVADLFVGYSKVRDWRVFVKEKWFDILMVIPYFRVLRILRFLRLLRFARFAKVLRLGSKGESLTKATQKAKRVAHTFDKKGGMKLKAKEQSR